MNRLAPNARLSQSPVCLLVGLFYGKQRAAHHVLNGDSPEEGGSERLSRQRETGQRPRREVKKCRRWKTEKKQGVCASSERSRWSQGWGVASCQEVGVEAGPSPTRDLSPLAFGGWWRGAWRLYPTPHPVDPTHPDPHPYESALLLKA